MNNEIVPKLKLFLILMIALIFASEAAAQNINIVDYLKRVEKGEADAVRKEIPALLKANPNNPSLLFLDAVLTEAGESALEKYKRIYKKYPKSRFADAAVYRIFSYYFALGIYGKAEEYLTKLKNEYPSSAYIKIADRSIPEEELERQIAEAETKKEEIQESPRMEIEKETEKFTVQAGAFLNYKNAERLKNNFQKKGLYSSVYPKEVGGSILNVVIVGKFKSKNDAADFLPELKKQFNLNGRVVSYKGE